LSSATKTTKKRMRPKTWTRTRGTHTLQRMTTTRTLRKTVKARMRKANKTVSLALRKTRMTQRTVISTMRKKPHRTMTKPPMTLVASTLVMKSRNKGARAIRMKPRNKGARAIIMITSVATKKLPPQSTADTTYAPTKHAPMTTISQTPWTTQKAHEVTGHSSYNRG
jgi:hypothetical protein